MRRTRNDTRMDSIIGISQIFKKHAAFESCESSIFFYKNPVLQLFTTFPAPDNWLAVPPEERPTFRHRDSRDLWYVIFWAWHTGFCKGNDVVAQYRRNDLVCYLSTRGRVNLSDFPVKMGLLKNSEAEHIRKKTQTV